jgi:sugar lactone lactonase YvrE
MRFFIFIVLIFTHCQKPIPSSIRIDKKNFFPEGIEYDSSRKVFLIGSGSGEVGTVSFGGEYKTLLKDPMLHSATAIKIDRRTNSLLVLNSHGANLSEKSSSNLCEIRIYDVITGKFDSVINLNQLKNSYQQCSDLAQDYDGNIYVIDGSNDCIYKINKNKEASIFFEFGTKLLPDQLGVNGIAIFQGNTLILSHFQHKKLYKIDLSKNQLTEFSIDQEFLRMDGIQIDEKDNVLVLKSHSGIDKLSIDINSNKGKVIDHYDIGNTILSKGTLTDQGTYILDGYKSERIPVLEFYIKKVEFLHHKKN